MVVDTLDMIRQLEADPGLRAQLRVLLLTEEVLQLPQLVAENSRDIRELSRLAEALLGRVGSLERGQASLERGQASLERGQAELLGRVGSLEAVQEATLVRLGSLERGQEALERGQASLERGQASLERGFLSLRTEVGRLSAVVGGTVEEDASSVVTTVLEGKGWTLHGAPQPLEVNGEIDVFVRATSAEGEEVGVLVEAKTRLRPADVRRFAPGLDHLLAEAGIDGVYLAYVYGLRVYTGAEVAATELGIGVLCPDGERVPGTLRSR